MSRVVSAGWVGLLGAMSLLGGAFLPSQLAAVSAGAVVLAAGGLVLCEWRPDRAERLILAGAGLVVLGLAISRADVMNGMERLGWWLVAGAVLALGRRLKAWRWENLVLSMSAAWVAAAVCAEGWVFGAPRVAGFFDNPNVAAAVLLPALLLLPDLEAPAWCRGGLAALLGAGIVCTGSRAALLALVVAAVVLAPKRLRRWWPVLLVLVAAVGAWRLAAWPDPLAWRRPAIWRASLMVVREHPLLGASAGGFDETVLPFRPEEPSAVARWSKRPDTAESTPLQMAAELGLPAALLVLMGAAVLVSGRGRSSWRRTEAALLAAIAVLAMVHDVLGIPILLWLWAWLAGRAIGPPAEVENAPRPLWAKAVMAVALVALLGRAVLPPELVRVAVHDGSSPREAGRVEPLASLPWALEARRLLNLRDWSWEDAAAAGDAADRALEFHRRDATTWYALAECRARTAWELGMTPAVLEGAEIAFDTATSLDPHSPWAWLAWARAERNRGRLNRAVALARRAVIEEPCLVRGWLLIGRLALDSGQVDKARAALARSLAARDRGRGRLLTRYERDLVEAPSWEVRQLQEALP